MSNIMKFFVPINGASESSAVLKYFGSTERKMYWKINVYKKVKDERDSNKMVCTKARLT